MKMVYTIQVVLGIVALGFILLSIFEIMDRAARLKAENEHLRDYCGEVEQKADRVLKMIESSP